jgi:hypothetical protein
MKIHATGGTDIGTIVLFWPATLPENAEAIFWDDPSPLFDKMIYFPTGAGDGTFPVSIFVDLAIPPELLAVCRDPWNEPWKYDRIEVRGEGYYGGGEHFFKNDKSQIEHLAAVEIPKGTYSVTVYDVEDYRSLREQFVRKRAGLIAKWLAILPLLLGCGFLLSLCLSCGSWKTEPMSALIWLGIGVVLAVVGVASLYSRKAQSFIDAEEEAKRVFPSFVAQFTRTFLENAHESAEQL